MGSGSLLLKLALYRDNPVDAAERYIQTQTQAAWLRSKRRLEAYPIANALPSVLGGSHSVDIGSIGILIVTLWSFCAYDVMRLEPYFQLAMNESVPAPVLLINYNFSYGILAPIRAARYSHWLTVNTWPNLIDPESQAAWMDDQVLPNGHTDLGAQLRLLPSSEYAMAPLVLPADNLDKTLLISLNQTIYWANLTCVDISLDRYLPTSFNSQSTDSGDQRPVSFEARRIQVPGEADSSSGCTVDVALERTISADTNISQIRYWEPRRTNTSSSVFNSSHCDRFVLYGMVLDLGLAAKNSNPISHAAAFACSATYHYANANVSMFANSSVTSVSVDPDTVGSLGPAEFQMDKFQDLMRSKSEGAFTEDSIAKRIDRYQRDVSSLWEQTFIVTMSKLFDPTTSPVSLDAQQVATGVSVYVISRTALAAESILGAAAVLLLLLSYVYPRRPSFLRSDPGPIGAQCGIIADFFHPGAIQAYVDGNLHKATSRQLRQWSNNLRCQWQEGQDGRRIALVTTDGRPPEISARAARRTQDPNPHFLIIPWFLFECILLVVTVVFFVASLQRFGFKKRNPYYTTWDLLCLMLLVYAPNVVASMVTVLLASSLRHLSTLEPWVQLQRGMATAKQSLSANYASQVPLAVLAKCRKGGPPLLMIVSLACTLDLILSLVIGGIFVPQVDLSAKSATSLLYRQYSPSTFSAPASAVKFNSFHFIPMNTSMPQIPWTTNEYSFIPIGNDDDEYYRTFYTTTTRGIGASLTCRELPANHSWSDTSTGNRYWHYQPFDDTANTNCTVEVPSARTSDSEGIGDQSIRYLTSAGPTDCQMLTILVLARWGVSDGIVGDADKTTALQCQPKIHIQDFEIDFDFSGQIQAYRPVPGSSVTNGDMFLNASKTLAQYNQVLTDFLQRSAESPSSPFSRHDWPGILTAHTYERWHPSSSSFAPDSLISAAQTTYSTMFSTYISLRRDLFLERLTGSSLPALNGTMAETDWEMELSIPTVVIVIVIISLDFLVMAGVFLTRRGRYLGPRIPRSIGALIPWVTHSQMMRDFQGACKWNNEEWESHLAQSARRYRFGETVCADEVSRLMIDYDTTCKEHEQGRHKGARAECVPVGIECS
ncbi:hypothetical protein EYZ11_004417 [Aspergillus tanneri]|uniref:Uncharacterized protein n=1 Tax=Aspergillus tanneri TaxID=1220188 RepID=A0A4S3JL19_9EURO|nr:hypothetical protein EYZ11_004417 [Aspergillus tanneri]